MLFKKSRLFTFLFLALGITIILYSLISYFEPLSKIKKTKKYIAYIGRYTDYKDTLPPDKRKPGKFDMMHEVTLKHYIKNMNLPHTDLELKTFDCQKNGKNADSIYKNIIAKDKDIIAVIDNTWGQDIRECAATIKENKIPVISINADRNNLDFGSTIIFTGNNDHVPSDLSAFVTKILKTKKVNFISEIDYPIHDNFLKTFETYGITPEHIITVRGKNFKEDSAALYQQVNTLLKNNLKNEETILVLNVHVNVGNHLIKYLDKNFDHLSLIGHTYIVNAEYVKNFGKGNHNDLILITNPTDAMTKRLYHDISELKKDYPDYFQNPTHPMFVKRCMDATEILKNKFEFHGDTADATKEDFVKFYDWLRNRTISEEDEIYEFDSLLTVVPELYFTEYSKGKLHSYPLQLNLEREVIPNLFFGMEIVDIYNIDMNSNSFTADFYYWVKLDSSNAIAEQYIIFQNMKQNESSRELIFEKLDGSTIYKLYKVSGIFYVNYELRDYPFDQQELFIRAEILNPSSKLKVSFDQKSFQLDSNAIEKFKITEWEKVNYYVTVDNEINMGMHGDPDIEEEKLSEFKNIYFRLNVKRKVVTPLLEIILPLLLIGLISISLLFMKDISFENLGEVSIGVFMSVVAFSISFSASTPNADDLTKADFLFWLTFIVVLLNFMIVIVTNAIYDEEQVKKLDLRRLSLFVGIMYFGVSIWFLLR